MQVLESPANLLTLVIQLPLKTIFCSISFGFLFRKGLFLQLLCIRESWKNLSESWKSPRKLFLEKDTNPVLKNKAVKTWNKILSRFLLFSPDERDPLAAGKPLTCEQHINFKYWQRHSIS